MPGPTDARAAQLRAQVEQLARLPDDGTMSAAHAAGPAEQSLMGGDQNGMSVPMLIRSSDSGVYLKWSLMLQDQLGRMKAAYDALKEENAHLRM